MTKELVIISGMGGRPAKPAQSLPSPRWQPTTTATWMPPITRGRLPRNTLHFVVGEIDVANGHVSHQG